MKLKKAAALVLAASMLTGMLTGCSGNQDKETKETVSAEKSESSAEAKNEIRDVLNIGTINEAWIGTDVIQCDNFYDIQMTCAEPLFLYNHDTGEIEACLASKPEISEDGTVMSFEIPEGLKYYNGEELEPEDVKASLEYVQKEGTMSEFLSVIKNIEIDGNKITLTMEHYSTSLIICLANPCFAVIDKDELESLPTQEEKLWGVHPYGPYYVETYTEGSNVILKRNEGYSTQNELLENKGPANIETINLTFYEDEFAALNAFKQKDIDYIIGLSEDGVAECQKIADAEINSILPPMVRDLEMNATTGVLQDKNLRLAISYLIDRQSIVEVFGGDLMCQPAYSYVTKNILFHCDDTDEYYKTNYTDKQEEGLQLLKDSGWEDTDGDGILDKDGEKLSLKFIVASGANEIAAVELQRQLNSFGFDVQIETMEYNKLRECYNNKDYDIGISNYWWSEPAYHLWMIVYDQNNGIDMEKYRAMCSGVENSFNGEETFKLVDETQRYLMDHVTLAPLYITSFAQAYYNDVKPIFVVDGLFLNDCK